MRTYPRIGSVTRIGRGMCQICREQWAKFIIDIEFDYMRGDDECLRACGECRKLPVTTLLERYQENKEKPCTPPSRRSTAS